MSKPEHTKFGRTEGKKKQISYEICFIFTECLPNEIKRLTISNYYINMVEAAGVESAAGV